MAFFPLKLPPGLYRNGTQYQAKGRWLNANLIRFFQGAIMPLGGWRTKSPTTLIGKGRAIVSWHDNSSDTWSGIGTEQKLYAMTRDGTLSDITPSGFTVGRADAVAEGGYGDGTYGAGYNYGAPIPDQNAIQEASMWSMDNFGQYLIGIMAEDGFLYQWTLNTGTAAAKVSGAPTGVALLVTAEGMAMVLGANNNPRLVQWCDQQVITTWTPSASNQAGDYQLGTAGRLMMGLRIKSGNLIFTDVDVWLAYYEANSFVYGFNKVGQGCGAISRGCAIAVDAVATAYGAQAVWMGTNGFWLYNGYVLPLACDVWDAVFGNLNILQRSKITAEMNSAFGEITWHYPGASSTEVDSYVTWNFRENHWTMGLLARFAGVDAGVNSFYPMRVGNDGTVYEHDVGHAYPGSAMPFLESGPVELGNGDQIQYARKLIPDDITAGDVEATFFVKFEPDDIETGFGPYTVSKLTDVRFAGRQLRVRYDGVNLDAWRIGVPRLDLVAGGLR
ncbi:MAG: hypothetical protein ACREFW_07095 [Rhizomicrobium sp.]